jgi:predicted CXXCH cytochrome family protein
VSRRRRPARSTLPALLALLAAGGCEHATPGDETADPTIPVETVAIETSPPPPPAATPPAPRPREPVDPAAGCVTAECHASFESARRVHGAVSTGDCFVCHGPEEPTHVFPLLRPGPEGCTFCHSVRGNHRYEHAANEVGCTACHDPHVSDTKFLLPTDSVESLCATCHVTERLAVNHAPFAEGECLACHEPHESNHAGLLRGGEGPEHCFMCHAETRHVMQNASFLHAPAAEGCTSCHSPHATDHEHVLHESIEQTCFACHADLEQTVAEATAPHAAVFTAERCANCHDPHGAGRHRLLRDEQTTLCLGCHGEPIRAADGRTIPDMEPLVRGPTHLHGPVRAGDCVACHSVHGAAHARLLREKFTSDFYASFDLTNYALCFECHDEGLVTTERTASLTGFRDGDLNLHYLHVNRQEKGRSCRTCHVIHGSNLPKHVAENVPFEGSDWAMPLGFEAAPGGGSCGPGCHEPMTYRRGDPAAPTPTGGAP